MKRCITTFLLAILLIVMSNNHLIAQETPIIQGKISMNDFVEKYNTNEFETIFNMFANVMKDALHLDKTISFLNEVKEIYGEIKKYELIGQESSFAVYKVEFEKQYLVIKISIDSNSKINGLLLDQYNEEIAPERSGVELILPFKNTWYVVWGGETREDNYHVIDASQKGAFDFVIVDKNGKSYKDAGKENTDYYAYGEIILAPCSGEVVMVVDGIKDNKPGKMNPYYAAGNSIIIKTEKEEYILIGHMIPKSIVVTEGQKILQGSIIGKCGNSGNSSEAHIHIHMQNKEEMSNALGIRMYFKSILVYCPIQTT